MLNINLSQLSANDFVFDAGSTSMPTPSGVAFDGTTFWGGSIQGTAGVDTVSYANANYAIYVDLAHGYSEALTSSPDPKEQLTSIENITGAPNNLNYLHGDQNDNVLIGGNNFNWFEGGGGNNTLIGGTGTDLADYLGTNGPVTIDLPAGKVYHGNYVDTLSSIEQFRGTTFGDTFTGDAANDYYVSLGGNAKIYGGTGNNWFEVYSGDNTMVGGSGNDKLVAGTGSDVLTGGGGANTFVIGAHGAGHTEITDFNAAAGDRIDFSQDALVKQMSDLTVSDDGHGNAMVSYSASDGTGTIVLDQVAPTAVSAVDFLHFTLPPSGEVAADQTIILDSTFSGTVNFLSDTGMLKLENSLSFAGTVAGLRGQDAIDLADIGFGASSTLGYLANADNSGGTLSVGDGTHMANIALLGSYMASSFVAASDGHGGTLISETAQSATQMPVVTQPHA
jgi:Ca2+-binding RTX toxin-like protein